MDFQIIESQRSLPGRGAGVHGRPETETGQGELYRIMGQLGGTLADIGQKIYIKEGVAEVTQKLSEANEAYLEMRKQLVNETDPEKYWQTFTTTSSRLASAEIKNGWAKERYKTAFAALQNSQAKAVLSDWERQVDENYNWALANFDSQIIKSGNMNTAKAFYDKQVKDGLMLKDEAEIRIGVVEAKVKARMHADTQQALSAYAYEEPETVLSWKNSKDMMKVFPDSEPTDLTWIQGVARNAITIRNQQKEVNVSKYYNIVDGLAAQSIDMDMPEGQRPTSADVLRQIQQLPDLTNEEKTALVKKYNESVRIWSDTGTNPFKTTANQTKFVQMKYDALDGKLTEKQIREAEGRDISLPDADKLRNIMQGKGIARASEETEGDNIIKSVLSRPGVVKDKYQDAMIEEGYRRFHNAIEAAKAEEHPLGRWELKKEALSIAEELKKQKSIKVEELTPIVTPEELSFRGLPMGESLGLGEIWDDLSAESRTAALDLLIKGATPEQLIAYYKSKK
jgi:hypothetical protein